MREVDPKIFACRQGHQFIIYVPRAGEMTSRGTPVHRVNDCEGCTMAVEAAYAYCMDEPLTPPRTHPLTDGADE